MPLFPVPSMNVTAVGRSRLRKPVALLLALLVSPLLNWIGPRGANPSPLQANAQVASLCDGSASSIIRNYCVDGISYATHLVPFERQAVEAVLAMHGMDASEVPTVYSVGRRDLRNSVRAMMHTQMLNIIAKKPADRTTQEQEIYTWMQKLMQGYEIRMYEQALSHYNFFVTDPCRFRLDNELASTFEMQPWNGLAFCSGSTMSSIFVPTVPNAAYFKSYGLKKSYMAKAEPTDPTYSADYASVFNDTTVSTGEIFGVGLAVGAGTAAAAGIGIIASFAAAYSAYLAGLAAVPATLAGGAAGGLFLISGSSFAGAGAVGIAAAAAGPVAIIFITVATMFIGGYMLYENERQTKDILDFTSQVSAARAALPDLPTFANDKTGQGHFKLQSALYSQTTPDIAGTAAMPGHLPGDAFFVITPRGGESVYTEFLRYLDWDKNVQTVRTSGKWLIATCAKGPNSTRDCRYPTSISGILRYENAAGQALSASRSGMHFTNVKPNPAPTDQVCPIDARALITLAPDLTKCVSFVSTALEMKDPDGYPISVALSSVGEPSFVDPGPLSFGIGVTATKNITAFANPPAQICLVSGADANFTLPACANGSYPVRFNGSTTANTGFFDITLRATNEYGSKTQTFRINVDRQLAIISTLDCTTFSFGCYLPVTYGQPVNYRVVATGNPTPGLSLNPSGSDFTGLTFTDNGDGTGTLQGIALGSPFSGGTCGELLNPPCGGFQATNNTQGSVIQRLRLAISPTPTAELDGPRPLIYTFPAGRPTTVALRARRATTLVAWSSSGLPPWLSLIDNGDNTALLRGTAPLDAPEWTGPIIGMTPAGSTLSTLGILINVPRPPSFTSADNAVFRVGTPGAFNATVSNGSITHAGTLPQGLSFSLGNPFVITGTPAVGSGGIYPLVLFANNANGLTTQTLAITVNEPPSIISPNHVVAFAGKPFSHDAIAYGYPLLGTKSSSPGAGFVNDPELGMQFLTSGLPASLQANSRNIAGRNTGALRISGTPTNADVGTRRITITASNTIGSPATQTLTLQVLPYNPISPVSLLSLWSLSRDAAGNILARITVANQGSQTAENVAITSARIGTTAGSVTPTLVASIPGGTTATLQIAFPPSTGLPGAGGVINLAGSYRGGTFSTAGRIVLP